MAVLVESDSDSEDVLAVASGKRQRAATVPTDMAAEEDEEEDTPEEPKPKSRLRKTSTGGAVVVKQDPHHALLVGSGLGTSLTPMERRQFGRQEKKYRQVRDKILTFWSQNEQKWVDLERCVLECENEDPELVAKVYDFLSIEGCINVGVMEDEPDFNSQWDAARLLKTAKTLQRWVKAKVWSLIESADLEETTAKGIRQQLEASYGPNQTQARSELFAALKPFVKAQIESCLAFRSKGATDEGERNEFLRGYLETGGDGGAVADTGVGLGKLVVVVGAGPAGLACARHLRRHGCRVEVLEGRERVGGRVATDRDTFSVPVDLGASIITGVSANVSRDMRYDPSVTVLGQIGAELTEELGRECPIFDVVEGCRISGETDEKVASLWDNLLNVASYKALNEYKSAREGGGPGKENLGETIQEVLRGGGQNEEGGEGVRSEKDLSDQELRVLRWFYAHQEYGCSARMTEISVEHWNDDENVHGSGFGGGHVMVPGGYSEAMEAMARGLGVRTGEAVTKIAYGEGRVEVTCERRGGEGGESTIVADSVVVTAPLGCLKRRKIEFSPPLPDWKQSCIDRLGYGNLNKLVLEFEPGEDGRMFWEKGSNSVAEHRMFGLTSEDPESYGRFFMAWNMRRVCGAPILVLLLAGEAAYEPESGGHGLDAKAMKVLRKLFHDVEVPGPTKAKATAWLSDEFSNGSYSYVAAGASGEDYNTLALPVSSLVHFAGEHTWRKNPDTVGGAMLSGMREAQNILRMFARDASSVAEDLEATLPAEEEEEGNGVGDLFQSDSDVSEGEERAATPKRKAAPKPKRTSPKKKPKKEREKKIVGSVQYLSPQDHALGKEEISRVYKSFASQENLDLGGLMGSLKSLEGRRALVKQACALAQQGKVVLTASDLDLLNAWVLEYRDAPLCADFVLSCVRLLRLLRLPSKDLEGTDLGDTVEGLLTHRDQKVKKLAGLLLQDARRQTEREAKVEGERPDGAGAGAGAAEAKREEDEAAAKRLEEARRLEEEIRARKEAAQRKHAEASRAFQAAAEKMGVLPGEERPPPAAARAVAKGGSGGKRKRDKSSSSSSAKRSAESNKRPKEAVIDFIKSELKAALQKGGIDKDAYKRIFKSVWGKLEGHKALKESQTFLTSERRDKIKKLIAGYVQRSKK